ncbi:MAG TPA: type I restriction endonuclease subunit R [Anaerolineaceae bacterium]
MPGYTEDELIEQPAKQLLATIGWQIIDAYCETFGHNGTLGRENAGEVILYSRWFPTLEQFNPGLSLEVLQLAANELSRDRSSLSPAEANRDVYQMLKEGVRVTYRDEDGNEIVENVQVIDWNCPRNNDFLLVSQLWVTGDMYKRRADLVGFVNGIPLLFIELKASHVNLKHAYDDNLRDYKNTIPHLFWYNGLIVLSNGSQALVGSITSPWEYFNEWKKINSEGDEGIISLETVLRGTCTPERLLDLIENFTVFKIAAAQKGGKAGGLIKVLAKNHQYLGVNNAFEAVRGMQKNRGRLGVFWHTQGSGKSLSMVFFSQKVLRKLPGNWTFLVVTDRQELDQQIYKNFADSAAVTEAEKNVRAESGEHLKQLLREDHRYLFTLIQKFHIERGQTYPVLSERSDIIVMTDEAHRSQYDVLALNMRNALPNAAFIGFTGTPLMAGEERTRQVFGDYVSIYNFKQSVDDQATVPLFYENRIPELQLINPDLNNDMADVLDSAMLDESQEHRLEREFSREYHLITRDERLEKVAEDIVLHFLSRGYQGKAMVISIDKATAVRMYDKVTKHWRIQLAMLQAEWEDIPADERTTEDWQTLKAKIDYMLSTDMAVVVSQGQNEIEDMQEKGLDIKPHRKRMVEQDLATKFKDPDDPFRLVFVCAMWMTGFDAPSCSTIYLDKPMRNHTLMQTIARANRVFREKVNGLIVDYIGVFRDLQKALAIYGSGAGGEAGEGEMPVKAKEALVADLRETIKSTQEFLAGHNVETETIQAAEGFMLVKLLDDAVDALVSKDDIKREYLLRANQVDKLFHAILPDRAANEFGPVRKTIVIIAQKILNLTLPPDISGIMDQVEKLLDVSIAPKDLGYVIHSPLPAKEINEGSRPAHWVDLSQVDFDALKKQFEKGRKHTEIEKLRGKINAKLARMVRLNRSRMNYYEQFQKMIDEYNAGVENLDAFFAQLISFAQDLNQEEQRGISEQLNEEELAVFDLLTRPEVKLTRGEREQVKKVARDLLHTLRAEKLVLDWRKHQQSRAGVRLTIEEKLDQLPTAYDKGLYQQKCEAVFQHVYDAYQDSRHSIYIIT